MSAAIDLELRLPHCQARTQPKLKVTELTHSEQLLNSLKYGRSSKKKGSNPKSKLFGIHFGSIDIKIWGRSQAINTYFRIQTKQKVWNECILFFRFFLMTSLCNIHFNWHTWMITSMEENLNN